MPGTITKPESTQVWGLLYIKIKYAPEHYSVAGAYGLFETAADYAKWGKPEQVGPIKKSGQFVATGSLVSGIAQYGLTHQRGNALFAKLLGGTLSSQELAEVQGLRDARSRMLGAAMELGGGTEPFTVTALNEEEAPSE